MQEGALLSLWGAVIGSAGTLVWAGSSLGVVHQLNILVFVLLVGVWATLQFRLIYRDEPGVARLLERCACALVLGKRGLEVAMAGGGGGKGVPYFTTLTRCVFWEVGIPRCTVEVRV